MEEKTYGGIGQLTPQHFAEARSNDSHAPTPGRQARTLDHCLAEEAIRLDGKR